MAALAGLHVLAAINWLGPQRYRVGRAPQGAAITYVMPLPVAPRERAAPPPRAATVARAPQPAAARALRPITVPQPITTPQPITMPPPATASAPPSDPFNQPPRSTAATGDLLQQAIKSAGNVDRQLRKESGNPRDKIIANNQTSLAGKIAGAYVGDSGVEEIEAADGRRTTRIRSAGGGVLCATRESNASGADPIRDGGKTKVTTCN